MNTKTVSEPKTKESQSVRMRYLTITGLFAAMIAIMTAYICHIPVGANNGYIHFGDSLIYLAAALLPTPYALAAAAIGGGLADLMTSPLWVPATIIIKMLITIPFSSQSTKIVTKRNIIATIIAYFISGFCYYEAEALLFGTSAALFASMTGSLIQSGGSAVFFVIFGLALDKIHLKAKLANQMGTLKNGD